MKKSSTPKKTATNSAAKKEEPSKPAKKATKVAPDTTKPVKRLKEETDEFEEFRIDDAEFGESPSQSGYDDEEDDSY